MSNVKRILFLCVAALTLAATLCAQGGLTGTISGIVKDPNGGVVPGAKVTAKNAATNAAVDTLTDDSGYYRFTSLVPGHYTLAIEAKGFRRMETGAQEVTVASALRQD